MRRLNFLFAILILCLLQITILDYFKVFNIKPDLLLISVVIAGLNFRLRWALAYSIFAGILKDTFIYSTFGINTLLFALWAVFIVNISKQISIDNNYMRAILVFIVSIAQNIIVGVSLIYSGASIPLGIFLRIVLLGSIYTAAISTLVLKLVKPALRFKPAYTQDD